MQQRDAAQQAAKTAAEKQGSGPDAQVSSPSPSYCTYLPADGVVCSNHMSCLSRLKQPQQAMCSWPIICACLLMSSSLKLALQNPAQCDQSMLLHMVNASPVNLWSHTISPRIDLSTSSLRCKTLYFCDIPTHMQSGPGQRQQQRRVDELEKELARLRQDGQAYRDDLRQQLEGAKQAATQARHEAAHSNALAGHEAKLVQQLQDDKARMADIVDNWKRQGREQQVRLGPICVFHTACTPAVL